MDLGIRGRVAMIAAASKGLGKACAIALAAEGCNISICARTVEELERTAKEITAAGAGDNVLTVRADVSVAEDLQNWFDSTIKRFGQVDILITNTGGPPAAKFMQLTDEQWKGGVDSTLMNVVRLCRLVIPGMQERKWGRIVHLTSFVAKQPLDDLTISSTIRAGLSGLTKTMANQVGPDGITVNALLTGHALTDRQYHLAEVRMKTQGITQDEYFKRAAEEIPLRRLASPKEMADVVTFLASERASYVSGVSIQVDGGLTKSTF
ncbi:MAG TPA: SDR family oxidoreductase [Blastocatellia bacterium]|nr:SDR family oxidoreductase [Blastocatellia bacterium]